MKRITLIISLINILNLHAQSNWSPIGARWHYNQPSTSKGNFVFFEITKDTVIKERESFVLEIKLNADELVSREYIAKSGDSVFYFNPYSNTFNLLYNFSAKIGDTIVVHNNKFKPTKGFFSHYDSIASFKYKVISIDSVLVMGEWIKRQEVAPLKAGEWGFYKPTGEAFYILDNIGSLNYFFGTSSFTTPEDQPSILRCYSDSDISYKNSVWNKECDFYSNINMLVAENKEALYPNPFNDQLNINSDHIIDNIEIYNSNGLLILSLNASKSQLMLNTSLFESGIYLVKILSKENIKTFTLLKQ